ADLRTHSECDSRRQDTPARPVATTSLPRLIALAGLLESDSLVVRPVADHQPVLLIEVVISGHALFERRLLAETIFTHARTGDDGPGGDLLVAALAELEPMDARAALTLLADPGAGQAIILGRRGGYLSAG